jgi:beta-galactosidase
MHDDIEGKANALSDADYTQTFSVIHELGCNFIRLAHYPHPKETYDWCDRLGIIVQTEVPCVNIFNTGAPQSYYDHLDIQYADMVKQHFNPPCIVFWGLFNEAGSPGDTTWAAAKLNYYRDLIRDIDPSRWVGYVVPQGQSNPSSYMGNPDMDWFGCNIYVGWYTNNGQTNGTLSNDPTSALNTRVNNIIKNRHKPLAYSEYGCGGNIYCHSESADTTTDRGNKPRHDIEYMMWLHEGHLAAIRNFPQLLFTGEWQLFDIAVSSRAEGYKVCLDGETVTDDNSFKYLNDKGLVMRDHTTKKDPFYLYKAEWNPTPFVHICGQNYTRKIDRVIKCYSNDGTSFSLYVNNELKETVTATNHIVEFTARTFNTGDVVRVDGANTSDTFTF